MSRRTKIIIAVAAVLLIIAGILLYYFFFRAKPPVAPDLGDFPPPSEDEERAAEDEQPTVLGGEGEKFKPVFRQLTETPVGGFVAGAKSGETLVRYVDRATGNVLEVPAQGGKSKRLTNTTIPKIHEALWNKAGTAVVLRYLKEDGEVIQTFLGTIKAGQGDDVGEMTGTFLPTGIRDLALAPEGSGVLYVREQDGGAEMIRADAKGESRTRVWSSPVSEWVLSWPKAGTALAVSKPSVFAQGVLLSIDLSTGAQKVMLQGPRGLTILSNKALSRLLYSQSTDESILLWERNLATGGTAEFPVKTLPEKCAFGKDDQTLVCAVPDEIPVASYPDVWYQGIISFRDAFWSVDEAGVPSVISGEREGAAAALDATKLQLSPDERFVVFVNKTDGTLWSLQYRE